MPLIIIDDNDGRWEAVHSKAGRELLNLVYERYRATALKFRNEPIRKVTFDSSLYVGQRECAMVPRSHADGGFAIVGSDDATTCHIIILHDQDSGAAAVGHFDGIDTPKQLKKFFKTAVDVLDGERSWDSKPVSFDIYIVGGFNDSRFLSERISEELLWLLHTQPSSAAGPINLHLRLACICTLNTIGGPGGHRSASGAVDPQPAVYGAAIDLRTSEVFPCCFEERGPEALLRSVRHFSDESDLLNIYDHRTKRFSIKPFPYYPIGHGKAILNLPDEWILQNMSTSPTAEPPHFARAVRDMIQFTIDNPRWQDVFANGPIEYERQSGQGWSRL